MISIIICTPADDITPDQRTNIVSTIGCDHEIIVIPNTNREYSIFQAYNIGVKKSSGEILGFIHNDVTFETGGWGLSIEHILKDNRIGLVGVIGGHIAPDFPAYYSECPYISSRNADNDNGKVMNHESGYWDSHGLADVAVVDGQQMFMPKDIFPPLSFDEERYRGFHGYDMDISMQVHSIGKRVVVTNQYKSVHMWNESKWDNPKLIKELTYALNTFVEKWQSDLPLICGIQKPKEEVDSLMNIWHNSYRYRMILQSKSYRLGKFFTKLFI